MTSLSWNIARRLLSAYDLWLISQHYPAPGWPAALPLRALAELQYPAEGTAAEKKKARYLQDALLNTMRTAIEEGNLPSVEHTRTAPVYASQPAYRFVGKSGRRTLQTTTFTQPTGDTRQVVDQLIERAAFRVFLSAQGVTHSEHVVAWLRTINGAPALEQEATQPEPEPEQLRVMRPKDIKSNLIRRFPKVGDALDRKDPWVRDCQALDQHGNPIRGRYYFEKIEEGCKQRWGNNAWTVPTATLSLAGQMLAAHRK